MRKFMTGPNVSVDTIVSFRVSEGLGTLYVRDWYERWLAYWPVGLGKLVIYTEEYPLVHRLEACLTAPPVCDALRLEFAKMDFMREVCAVAQL